MAQKKNNNQLLWLGAGAVALWWFFIKKDDTAPGTAEVVAPGAPVSLPAVVTPPVLMQSTALQALPASQASTPVMSHIVTQQPVLTAIAPLLNRGGGSACAGFGKIEDCIRAETISY